MASRLFALYLRPISSYSCLSDFGFIDADRLRGRVSLCRAHQRIIEHARVHRQLPLAIDARIDFADAPLPMIKPARRVNPERVYVNDGERAIALTRDDDLFKLAPVVREPVRGKQFGK